MDAGLIERDSWIVRDTDKVAQILWVHDELQFDCDPKYTEAVAELTIDAAAAAGGHFKLRVKVDAEAKIGDSWRDCH